jgi:hypothetical protein
MVPDSLEGGNEQLHATKDSHKMPLSEGAREMLT